MNTECPDPKLYICISEVILDTIIYQRHK